MRRPVLIAAAPLALLLGCAAPQRDGGPAPGGPPAPGPAGPPLVNDRWQILKMATAHGVVTIEVELRDLDAAVDLARMLVEPLAADYSEVLVYIYADGQGSGGHPPAKRIQWTADGGFVELEY